MKNTALLKFSLLAFALFLSACSKNEQASGDTVIRPVRTIAISMQDAMNNREFSGVVDADRKVDLAFRVGGTLVEVNVLEGEHVHANQLLARLDQMEFEIQLKSMQADFDRTEAEYLRARTLLEGSVISRSDFERAESQYFIAEAQLDKAKQELAYSSILAPFDGYIVNRHIENFSEVAPRTPVLTLMDLNSLVITIEVPESVMIQTQRNGIRPDLYATFEGQESSQFPLAIKEIGAQPNSSTQTYPVTLSLPPINHLNILPGMSAQVGVRPFVTSEGASVAYIPAQAVLQDNQGKYVFVAVPQHEGPAVIERKNVEVGDISSFGIQVTGGLVEGEQVVTAGMSQISSGMLVALMASN